MSNQGPSDLPPAVNQSGYPLQAPGPVAWPPGPPILTRGTARWPIFFSYVIALVAVGVGAVGWFRPAPAHISQPVNSLPAPKYTDEQIIDAKRKVCGAFDTVRKGIDLQTHAEGGSDPAMTAAAAANGRLSLVSGGWYLRDHLDPATPQSLAETIRSFSGIVLDLATNYLAGAKDADPQQADLMAAGESAAARIATLCK